MGSIKQMVVLGFVMIMATGCFFDDDDEGGDNGEGACVTVCQANSDTWCHNFHDQDDETGEEICESLSSDPYPKTWYAGESCADMGFTQECPDGSWFKSTDQCF